MSLLQKFIPKIPLPSFFRLESKSAKAKTRLSVQWNLDGNPGERIQDVEGSTATLLEVIEAFPGVQDKIPAMVKPIAGNLPLPPNWVLECGPAPKDKEGFLLTFDVGPKHWEKHLEVSTVQLNQLSDLIGWIAEANKVDRHRAK
jgi:hypothetical protein